MQNTEEKNRFCSNCGGADHGEEDSETCQWHQINNARRKQAELAAVAENLAKLQAVDSRT